MRPCRARSASAPAPSRRATASRASSSNAASAARSPAGPSGTTSTPLGAAGLRGVLGAGAGAGSGLAKGALAVAGICTSGTAGSSARGPTATGATGATGDGGGDDELGVVVLLPSPNAPTGGSEERSIVPTVVCVHAAADRTLTRMPATIDQRDSREEPMGRTSVARGAPPNDGTGQATRPSVVSRATCAAPRRACASCGEDALFSKVVRLARALRQRLG